jgi:hypothetical protein
MFFETPFFGECLLLVVKVTPPDDGFVDVLCPFAGVGISHVFGPNIEVFERLWRLATILGDADKRLEIFIYMASVPISAHSS